MPACTRPPKKFGWVLSVIPITSAVRTLPYTLKKNDTVGGIWSLVPNDSEAKSKPEAGER